MRPEGGGFRAAGWLEDCNFLHKWVDETAEKGKAGALGGKEMLR